MKRTLLATTVVAVCVSTSACLSTPPPKVPDAPVVAERQKMAWILQLEDQRVLKFDLPAPPPVEPVKGRKPAKPVVVPPP